MNEYINREALQNALQRKKVGVANQRYTEGWNDCMMRIKSMVSTAKVADVVEVVRCKDCKFRSDILGCNLVTGCKGYVSVTDNFYCSYGERRDNDATD